MIVTAYCFPTPRVALLYTNLYTKNEQAVCHTARGLQCPGIHWISMGASGASRRLMHRTRARIVALPQNDAQGKSRKTHERPSGHEGVRADQVSREIFKFHLLPGQRPNEAELAARIKVSRTPMREALRKLEREGYLALKTPWLVPAKPCHPPVKPDQ